MAQPSPRDSRGSGHEVGDALVELTDKPHPLVLEYYDDVTTAYVSLH